MWWKNKLEVKHICLEVDQLIYHKVIQVFFNAKCYDKLIVWLGGCDFIIWAL